MNHNLVICIFLMVLPTMSLGFIDEALSTFIADYFSYKRVWIIALYTCSTYDSVALSKTLSAVDKFWITSIVDIRTADHTTRGVFLDYDCAHNKDIFFKMSNNFMLNASFSWLIWSKHHYSDLEQANLNMESEVTWTIPENESSATLHDLYKIKYSWPVTSTLAGKWDITTGLQYNLSQYKYSRRADLQGVLFNAAVVVKETPADDIETRLRSEEDRHVDCVAKYNYALYRRLADKYNFTLQLHVTNSDDEMVRMVEEGEVQLGINSLIISSQHLDATDLTGATWQFRGALIFRHPLTVGRSNSLIRPFTRRVWLTVLTSWVLVMIAVQLINWLESRRENFSYLNTDHSWGASLITITGAISEQGAELESSWVTWRIIYLVTLVQVVLLNAYYGACLVSDLLQPPPKNILTVRDLLKSKLHVGYVDNKENQALFREMSDPVARELYDKRIHSAEESAFPFDVAVEKLHKEDFAIHNEAIDLYPTIERAFNNDDKCAITEIMLFAPRMTYTVIQKRSPYRKLFTYGFLKMMENGVMSRESSTWRPKPPMCQLLDKFYSVKMETVAFAFSILTCGVVASSILSLIEWFQITRPWKPTGDEDDIVSIRQYRDNPQFRSTLPHENIPLTI